VNLLTPGCIEYDATPLASATLRRQVQETLDALHLTRRDDVWRTLLRTCRTYPRARTLLVGDLGELARDERFACLAGGPPSLSVVLVVRTERDRRLLREPSVALQVNDEKFSLLQVEERAQRRDVADRFREHCLAVIARMQPDRLRAARFSVLDDTLWLEFGDGLERAVKWSTLPFAARLTIRPASASVRDQGEAVLLADADGNEVDIDAEVLRSSVDPVFGTAMDGRDRAERVAVGARLREIREERGLSQEQVQALSGIAQETLSRIENGHRDPRMDTLRKLAAGLSMDVPDLLARMAGARP
jgi:DNA-binding XRE family transcriptional regulator